MNDKHRDGRVTPRPPPPGGDKLEVVLATAEGLPPVANAGIATIYANRI